MFLYLKAEVVLVILMLILGGGDKRTLNSPLVFFLMRQSREKEKCRLATLRYTHTIVPPIGSKG